MSYQKSRKSREILLKVIKITKSGHTANSKHFVTLRLQLNSAPQSKGYACRGTNAEGFYRISILSDLNKKLNILFNPWFYHTSVT